MARTAAHGGSEAGGSKQGRVLEKRKTGGKGGSHGSWRRHNSFAGGRAIEDGPAGGWAASGYGGHNGELLLACSAGRPVTGGHG